MKATLIKTLLPWLSYAGSVFAGWNQSAAPAALTVLILGCLFLGFKPVDKILLIYFALVSVGVGIMDWAWLASIQPVVVPGMLASMALASVLLRRPFTLPYARESVKDPVILASFHFYRVNTILSALWGLAFLAAALFQLWALGRPEFLWIVTGGGFLATGFAAFFTWWFPLWYHKHVYEPQTARAEVAG
jgi:hypothetical protein